MVAQATTQAQGTDGLLAGAAQRKVNGYEMKMRGRGPFL